MSGANEIKGRSIMSDKTHVCMILDRSGSMGTCRESTIDAVNQYLLEARADDALKEADFNLTIFDSQSIDTIRTGPIKAASDITTEEYVPRATTPLYDAIGRGIDTLDGNGADKAVLVVVTDGYENASRKHGIDSIKELLKTRQDKGWLVVFLGAGLDAAQQGIGIGISLAKIANIGTDKASLSAAMCSVRGMSSLYAAAPNAEAVRLYSLAASFSDDDRRAMGDASAGEGLVRSKQPKTIANGAAPTAPADTWDNSGDAWGA
jgi:hypothetical protein